MNMLYRGFKNTLRMVLSVMGLLFAAQVAFSQSINSAYDKEVNLSRLKTYDYKVEERDKTDALASDTLMAQQIKDALEEALEANYYHQSFGGTPDFLVAYHVSAKDVTASRRVPLRGLPGPRGNLQIESLVQGTLTVDFIDPETRKLIWRGVATGIVGSASVDFKVAEEKIKAATKLLLEQFRKDVSGL
ncbi:MAG: DUF4136 domain-containing protein [Acidobacteriota bacterium]